MVPISTPWGDP